MRKPRRTLAVVASKLEDAVSAMQSPALYFSAYYDNKTDFDLLAEKVNEIVSHYDKVLGWWSVKEFNGDYKLGVVVYQDQKAADYDRKKGVNYERSCF